MESVSLWPKKKDKTEQPKFKSGGLVADIVPEIFTQQLVSKKTVLAKLGIDPSFDGVGDTMGFDSDPGSLGETLMYDSGECAWCGSSGIHKPNCQALAQNYPKVSRGDQREMRERIRTELAQPPAARNYYVGRGTVTIPEPPKDLRTEMQKRFDAIAEELDENK